ncbi:hypothetical protein LL033_09945 [Clostridium estertheticum]|uniref:hypothetical protein n=1 Tax=Clostridium estertheticum TaxID=238834 RepID=UPI001C0E4F7E|nr:hypothetical protein [Clostridium estertheticum]MBU3217790.1 hypothetical protein [Clostridium estertheticum]WAG57478.1 hypothetical protein LL033_09945 [Clostridium estertheticum]
MDNMDIAKGMIFKNLNINSKNSLDCRVIIQKKIYLLQEQEVDLGYEYNWYLKGPYSPTLTSYVYDNLDVLKSMEYKEVSLNTEVIRKITKVNEFQKWKPNNLSEASWYEVLASILYIFKNHCMWGIKDYNKENIIKTLIIEKPKYSNQDCEFALKKLTEFEYIKVDFS